MKTRIPSIAALLLTHVASHAVSNIMVTVQNTNVVLTWPSKANAAYLIQVRAAFDTNNPWVNLTNEYPAAAGTNRTSFIVYGAVCPPPTNSGGGSWEGGGAPSPNGAMAVQSGDGQPSYVTPEGGALTQEDLLPYPWNPRFAPQSTSQNKVAANSANSQSAESSSEPSSLLSGDCPGMGFYRIFQLPNWPTGI